MYKVNERDSVIITADLMRPRRADLIKRKVFHSFRVLVKKNCTYRYILLLLKCFLINLLLWQERL